MKHLLKIVFLLICSSMFGQAAFEFDTTFHYFEGKSEPPVSWNTLEFDDSNWNDTIANNIGYGNIDDSIVVDTVPSFYLRIGFSVVDKSLIKEAMLIHEFDDGYIAYINGKEIARINLGDSGTFVPYNQLTERSHEIQYNRQQHNQSLGFYLDSVTLKNVLVDGDNILAFQIHNDSLRGSDIGLRGFLYNLTGKQYDVYEWCWEGYKQVELDSSNLPIIKLNLPADAFISDATKYSGTMKIISDTVGYNKIDDTVYNYNGAIAIEIRGNSSAGWPKRSFSVETRDSLGDNLNIEILKMPRDNDWVLHGPFADRSLLRNSLAYTLGRQLPDYAPRGKFVDLIMNDEYMGVYYLCESIKRDRARIDIKKASTADVTGGYIFRWDRNNLEIIYPKPDEITAEQKAYIPTYYAAFVASKKNENLLDSVKGYRNYLARPSFIDYTILNELMKNSDAYRYSTYMYKDADSKGKKFHYGPIWDFDLTMGNSPWQQGNVLTGWQFALSSNAILEHKKLFQDTLLVDEFIARWHELRHGPLQIDSILNTIDSLRNTIGNGVHRNFDVWPMEGKSMGLWSDFSFSTGYEEEIQKLKTWFVNRVAWIDNNIGNIYYKYTPPVVISDISEIVANFNCYPNPITDDLYIEGNIIEGNILSLEISNSLGQVVYKQKISREEYSFTLQVPFENIPIGVYFVKLYRGTQLLLVNQIVKK